MKSPRYTHGCAMNSNQTFLYAIAGWNRNEFDYHETIEKYNFATDTWNIIPGTVQRGLDRLRCILDDIQTG